MQTQRGEDRAFAGIISDMMDRVEAPHRAMAQAGLVLLAAAVDGVGPTLAADASREETQREMAARIYHAAYKQGYKKGSDEAFDSLEAALLARYVSAVEKIWEFVDAWKRR